MRQSLAELTAPPKLAQPEEGWPQEARDSEGWREARWAAGERPLDADLMARRWLRVVHEASGTRSSAAEGEATEREALAVRRQQIEPAPGRAAEPQPLASVAGAEMPAVWAVELAVRAQATEQDPQLLRLRLAAKRRAAIQTASGWSLWLSLELPALGPLHVHLLLQDGRTSVQFWTPRPATGNQLRAHLETLRAELQAAGLEVGRLECHECLPRLATDPDLPPGALVEESA